MNRTIMFRYYQVKVILVTFMMAGLIACTDSGSEPKVCEAPVDTVSIINKLAVDDVVYYLVLRVTGWHDKTEIVELYERKPIFDKCAMSDVEPAFGDSLDLENTVSHIYLNSKTKKLNIEYIPGKPGKSHNASLKLELEPVVR